MGILKDITFLELFPVVVVAVYLGGTVKKQENYF
jgi:hypothetical protein